MEGDFLVDTPNPRALDATLQQLGGVLVGAPDYTRYQGHFVVRPLPASRSEFLIFACRQQGYCTVVGPAPEPAPWDVPGAADYLKTAGVWTILDLIVAEFESDPTSVQCFDLRLVRHAIELNRAYKADPHAGDEAIRTLLRGFEEGVFVRNTANDNDPAWAIKLLPYLRAMNVLQDRLGVARA